TNVSSEILIDMDTFNPLSSLVFSLQTAALSLWIPILLDPAKWGTCTLWDLINVIIGYPNHAL
ncbi:MAG: hypothetical protein ACYSU5_20605, partial [Planctomycetota bacterium]